MSILIFNKPVLDADEIGYERIVVTPTHINNKPFRGYVSNIEADTICKAIGLHNKGNHHGTSFYRSKNQVLFITFILKKKTCL